MSFDWRKWLTDFLLKIIKLLTKQKNHSFRISDTVEKNVLLREMHVPTWVVGLFIYFILLGIFFYEFGLSYKIFTAINLMLGGFVFFGIYFFKKYSPDVLECDDSVALIGLVLVVFVFITLIIRNSGRGHFMMTPLPAATMLLNIFLGPIVAFIVSMFLVIVMTLFYDYNFTVFLALFFMCLTAMYGTRNVMNRKDITKTGLYIGFFNFITIIVLHCFFSISSSEILTLFLWGMLNGIGSAIITVGVLPYMESFFSIVTNIKLLELSDFTQPILKKMLIEAPGTYHHSIVVGNLAETASREIDANPLLTRVGAYYHDIGKIEKAEYFIENNLQFTANKHDDLNANLSSLIIISHVKDGSNLAKKLKFPKKLIEIIEQHHGDSLISYFYNKAKKEFPYEIIDEKKFRYPYKKPRSKEAAIVMLADSVEASMHSEKDFSHSNLKLVVNKIINNKFIDGQLEDAEITLSDLNTISNSFITTLKGIYHNRISYPELKSGKDENNILK
jgi:hypothetical protein